MPYPVRVADRFVRQSAEQLVTMAGAVITGLTGNPAFPAPTVDLKAVQAAASSRITITDLVPGTTYMFQVRAVGGSTGYTDWSNLVSRMCA